MQADTGAIDALTGAFFEAFTTRVGTPQHIDSLYDLFLPGALIVKNVDGAGEVLDVAGFVEPRRAILSGGSMDNFREWETAQRTEVLGNVAHRFSRYQKYWTASNKPYGGTGVKALQFVRTADAWKISALAWDDFMAIRPLERGDVERIREIDAAAFAPGDQYDDAMYQTMAESPDSIVAVDRGAVAGYAFVQRNVWESDLHIRSLAIHPQHQHRGSVDLLVAESNAHAAALYTHLGFVAVEIALPGRRRMATAPAQSRRSDRCESPRMPAPIHRPSS
jgi:ribosomal protein S18 acetylase RimI-like enzyme